MIGIAVLWIYSLQLINCCYSGMGCGAFHTVPVTSRLPNTRMSAQQHISLLLSRKFRHTLPRRCCMWLACCVPLTMHSLSAALSAAATIVLCCAVLCCAVLCCAVLCCAVLCCVPQNGGGVSLAPSSAAATPPGPEGSPQAPELELEDDDDDEQQDAMAGERGGAG